MTVQELSNYGIAPDREYDALGYAHPTTVEGTATCSHPMAFVLEYRPDHFGCRLCGMTC